MISKELLCELGYGKVTHIGNVVGLYNMDCLRFECERIISSGRSDGKFISTNITFHIAIEVLAYKCKEWAYKRGFLIGSNCRQGITVIDINTHTVLNHFDVYIEDFTEFEIKACQWILENKYLKEENERNIQRYFYL